MRWLPALLVSASLAGLAAEASADTGALCHSELGSCYVEATEDEDSTAFECSCDDASEQSGVMEADPGGLYFDCAVALTVCGGPGPGHGDALLAPRESVAVPVEVDETDDVVEASGCTVGSGGGHGFALLLLIAWWRRR